MEYDSGWELYNFSIDNRTTILNEFTLHSRNVPNRKYQNINLENFQK